MFATLWPEVFKTLVWVCTRDVKAWSELHLNVPDKRKVIGLGETYYFQAYQ